MKRPENIDLNECLRVARDGRMVIVAERGRGQEIVKYVGSSIASLFKKDDNSKLKLAENHEYVLRAINGWLESQGITALRAKRVLEADIPPGASPEASFSIITGKEVTNSVDDEDGQAFEIEWEGIHAEEEHSADPQGELDDLVNQYMNVFVDQMQQKCQSAKKWDFDDHIGEVNRGMNQIGHMMAHILSMGLSPVKSETQRRDILNKVWDSVSEHVKKTAWKAANDVIKQRDAMNEKKFGEDVH